jgi:hypothetical protein
MIRTAIAVVATAATLLTGHGGRPTNVANHHLPSWLWTQRVPRFELRHYRGISKNATCFYVYRLRSKTDGEILCNNGQQRKIYIVASSGE